MKAMFLGFAGAIVIALAAFLWLDSAQMTTADRYTPTASVRLPAQ
ncbi:MAG: hypothetical protein ACT4P2_02970 [Pseudomonadota bacterium]